MDRLGNLDPSFGAGGVASLPGMSIAGFSLLDSGDIVAWGNPNGNTSALALGLIDGSAGVALQPPAVATTKYMPVVPRRILDTRDGIGASAGVVGAGGQIDVQIAGVESVPATGVAAVVLNVTATEAVQAGYVSVYPSGARRPLVSNLNLEAAGQTVANLVTVKVGANGKVALFTSGGTHLVADLAGYYVPNRVVGWPPADLDTGTHSRQCSGLGRLPQAKLPAGGILDLQITGRGPVPASGVSAVVLNVTADQATAAGFVTVWPAGQTMPTVSNLNLTAGETRANLVVVPVGAGGAVSLFTMGGADLIADVAGVVHRFHCSRWQHRPVRLRDSGTNARHSSGNHGPDIAGQLADTTDRVHRGGASQRSDRDRRHPHRDRIERGGATSRRGPQTRAARRCQNLQDRPSGQTVPNAAIVPLGLDAVSLTPKPEPT